MQALSEALGEGVAVRNFRFRAIRAHFTYKGHVDFDQLCRKMSEIGTVKRLSIVHELGGDDERGVNDEDDLRRYAHTHVAVEWLRPRDRESCRFADIEVDDGENLHPNIKTSKSMPWFKGLFYNYHQGIKVGKDGKKTTTPPVKLRQWGIANWEDEREMMEQCAAAPSLIDGCLVAGVVPKSVGDVQALQNATKKRKCETALACCDREWRPVPDDWKPEEQSLLIVGPTNAGKTNFAKAYFEHTYCLTSVDDIREVPDHATGLVFDDQEFATLPMNEQKMLSDCRVPCSIQLRYKNFRKPALPAIFTCNDLGRLFDLDRDTGAIATRTYVWRIPDDEKMYV